METIYKILVGVAIVAFFSIVPAFFIAGLAMGFLPVAVGVLGLVCSPLCGYSLGNLL